MPTRYKTVKINGKQWLLHRYVMECYLGHQIPAGMYVHHKNGDKWDNRIENLELIHPQAHSEHHNQKHPKTKACEHCGAEYKPTPTKRGRSKTCSRKCWHAIVQARQRARFSIEERGGVLYKPCRGCGLVLPWTIEFFFRNRAAAPPGLGSRCRPCTLAGDAARKHRAATP